MDGRFFGGTQRALEEPSVCRKRQMSLKSSILAKLSSFLGFPEKGYNKLGINTAQDIMCVIVLQDTAAFLFLYC